MSVTKIRALNKLTHEWQSAYELSESLATLNSLVRQGLADVEHRLGSMFMPRNQIMFRTRKYNLK